MWIEYELNFKGEVREKGMFNSEHIKWIQIEQHGGGYGQSLEMYYDGYDSKCVFIADDKDAVEKVWHALHNAIAGFPSTIAGIGYIRPVQRPFFADSTLIPSAYTAEDDPVKK
jgi:hypothetical protein